MRTLAQIEKELQALVDFGELGEASHAVITEVIQDIKEMQLMIVQATAPAGTIRLPDQTKK